MQELQRITAVIALKTEIERGKEPKAVQPQLCPGIGIALGAFTHDLQAALQADHRCREEAEAQQASITLPRPSLASEMPSCYSTLPCIIHHRVTHGLGVQGGSGVKPLLIQD